MPTQETKTGEQPLTLHYDLFDLPTAQHKAGLAGLLLLIESMKLRKLSPLPELVDVAASSAEIRFTQESLQAVFDDLYASTLERIESKSKWKGKTPLETIEKQIKDRDGKEKTEKRFVYKAVQPKGTFLAAFYPDGDGIWLKLWRNMLWSILRGIPKTRGVYEECRDGGHSSLAGKMLDELRRATAEAKSGKFRLERISSSQFVGAQDVNPERIPFKGRVEHNFLLHFWTLVTLIFSPRTVAADGELKDAGYVLAIPEPANLETFVEELRDMLRSLDPATAGYRPRDALITVTEEGGLEYLHRLTYHRIEQQDYVFSLAAIELYHMQKQGNNIRVLAAERILPDPNVLHGYEQLRQYCRNPLYRSLQIRNLLAGRPWYADAGSLFSAFPWEFFSQETGATPARFPFFGDDVRRKFRGIASDLKTLKGAKTMNDDHLDDELARRIYRIIGQYVSVRTEEKAEMTWDDFQTGKGDRKKYRREREKVCSNAFLAMRGRREGDFVEYFAGSICRVPQHLPEQDFLNVTQKLQVEPDKVKTLCMLALSAHSYLWDPKDKTDK